MAHDPEDPQLRSQGTSGQYVAFSLAEQVEADVDVHRSDELKMTCAAGLVPAFLISAAIMAAANTATATTNSKSETGRLLDVLTNSAGRRSCNLSHTKPPRARASISSSKIRYQSGSATNSDALVFNK